MNHERCISNFRVRCSFTHIDVVRILFKEIQYLYGLAAASFPLVPACTVLMHDL